MHYALSSESLDAIRQLLKSKALLAFDFDGTLAPIVTEPQRARMRPATRALLRHLVRSHTCMVLSGRSREDLQRKLRGTGIRHLIGNHGAEPWRGAQQIRTEVSEWERVLARELPQLVGVWIENKALSLTVHYRQCRQKREVRAGIAEASKSLKNVRLVEGKECISIVSCWAPHKGAALKAAMVRLGFDRALYLGDDDTDEDVFAMSRGVPPVFAIRVGRKERSHASCYLRNQEDVDKLLTHLLDATLVD